MTGLTNSYKITFYSSTADGEWTKHVLLVSSNETVQLHIIINLFERYITFVLYIL